MGMDWLDNVTQGRCIDKVILQHTLELAVIVYTLLLAHLHGFLDWMPNTQPYSYMCLNNCT